MSNALHVAVVGPESGAFPKIAEEMAASGAIVDRFADMGGLLGDAAASAAADVLVVIGHASVTRDMIMKLPRLRGIVSPITGTDGFDEATATERGILVANGQSSENYESMAEATIMLMLAASYDLHSSEALLQKPWGTRRVLGHMIRDKTIGLIGFGQIARAVATRLKNWGVTIQVYAPHSRRPIPDEVKRVSLEELLSTSDIISIHANLHAETRGLLNAERLRLLKPNAILVNTARGAIIDEAGLRAFCRERPDFRMALDVFPTEPLPEDSPLRAMRNVILTPRTVGHTQETSAMGPVIACDNAKRLLAGELPRHLRNPDISAAWLKRWGGA